MNKFFKSRYGFDKLNLILVVLVILFIFSKYLNILSIALIIIVIFRATSRNFLKRQMELRKFNLLLNKVNGFFDRIFRPIVLAMQRSIYRRGQKKIFKYVKCRYCGKKLRVPRNKGKIKITCPECKNQFITKT